MSVSPLLLQRYVPFCPRLFVGTALVNARHSMERAARSRHVIIQSAERWRCRTNHIYCSSPKNKQLS